MFPKAKVKRFNEGGSCAPAPNAYDAKMLKSAKSCAALPKSQRFESSKYITPGPGQYHVPSIIGAAKKSGAVLQRSASFRAKSSLADLSSVSTSSGFSKVTSTPRKMRRSISSGNLSIRKDSEEKEKQSAEMEALRLRAKMLEEELAEARANLKAFMNTNGENVNEDVSDDEIVFKQSTDSQAAGEVTSSTENADPSSRESPIELDFLKEKVELLEAELETCKQELRCQKQHAEDLFEERERLSIRLDMLEADGARVSTLRGEIQLLTQDSLTLEEHLVQLRKGRQEAESALEAMRQEREELAVKCADEDAKNAFLHFTQEQLSTQVVSLDKIVTSVRQENQLLNRGVAKLVAALQEEKQKLSDISEAYTKENADSEVEFNKLQNELASTCSELGESRQLIAKYQYQINEADAAARGLCAKIEELDSQLKQKKDQLVSLNEEKDKLQDELAEANRDLEVYENDKTALREAHDLLEKEKNGLALDLADLVKSKQKVEEELSSAAEKASALETRLADFEKTVEDLKSEILGLEMSKAGIQGENFSMREEIAQLEKTNETLQGTVQEKESKINNLEKCYSEQVLELELSLLKVQEELKETMEQLEHADMEKSDIEAKFVETCAELEDTKVQVSKLQSDLKVSKDSAELSQEVVLKLEAEAAIRAKELKAVIHKYEEKKTRWEEATSAHEQQMADLEAKLQEAKIGREEVEESLLDARELVSCMESKLEEAHKNHRLEADKLSSSLKTLQTELEDVQGERQSLIQMNNDLSSQVSESLHAIANLQQREKQLGDEVQELQVRLECALEDGERERINFIQAEDEILSLQAELDTAISELGETEASKQDLIQAKDNVSGELEKIKVAYNSAVRELTESKTVGRQLLDRLTGLENERVELVGNLALAKKELDGATGKCSLLEDNVKHLESLRDNLELNVSDKINLLNELKNEMDLVSKETAQTRTSMEDVKKTNFRLKGNLELRVEELKAARTELDQCRAQIVTTTEELESLRSSTAADKEEMAGHVAKLEKKVASLEKINSTLHADREELVAKVESLKKDREEMEAIRMKEIDIMVELRDEVDKRKKELEGVRVVVEEAESAKRSMEAQQRLLCEAESKTADAEDAADKWKEKMSEAEQIMTEMESRIQRLEEEKRGLEEMIEPFKDQLERYEAEKRSLLSQSEQAQDEMVKLSSQYAKLLGHQNQKQRIHYVEKMKQENIDLKSEITKLRDQLGKAKRNVYKLEEKLNESTGVRRFDPRLSFQPSSSKNKENLSGFSTPLVPARPDRQLTRSSSLRGQMESERSPLRSNRK